MRIALDVMGGDHGCKVVVLGALLALRSTPAIQKIYLVGDQTQIAPALHGHAVDPDRLEIVHASEVLTMQDKPVEGLRRKRDCSILRAVDLVKLGKADAVVSPGNTGGVVTAAVIRLRPLEGVERPAIMAVIPSPENPFVLVDAGANVECRPLQLVQFAIMGHVYARDILGAPRPRVGLLSVGVEEVKGNDLTLETFKLCRQVPIHFIGNVEGHDLFSGRVDVVVADGFVGNIVLKTCESLSTGLFRWLKKELTKTPKRALGALLAKGAFRAIKRKIDPEVYGGAPLMGLRGHVVIAHGSSREHAIMNAVRQAAAIVQHRVNDSLIKEIAEANRILRSQLNSAPAQILA